MAAIRTRRLVVAGAVIVLTIGAAVPAVVLWRDRQDHRRMRQAAEVFATAWRTGRLETVAYAGSSGSEVADRVASVVAGLTSAEKDTPASVDLMSVDEQGENRATERLRVRWDLGSGRTWEYETSAGLVRAGGGSWQVTWTPAVVHPGLVEGQVLTAVRERAERGRILGSGGQVLVTARPVVLVGIQPGRASDRRASAAAMAAVVGVDAVALTKRVLAASPDTFVDVITLRRADYLTVKGRLHPIPGAVFRETTLSLAPTSGFARAMLGTMGYATEEIVKASKGRVQPGDLTGLSGLQRRYDEQLAGTAGLTVRAVPAPKSTGPGAAVPTVDLHSVPATPGRDLQTSLDEKTQRAAEAALATAGQPAGLVAIRPSTGEVLAVANGGPDAAGYNRALIGRYAPGSTFKMVTAYALLENGLSPDASVACPPTINVGGRVFKNAENEVLGNVAFRTDFAHSCNTAFIGAAQRISPEKLYDAATALGFGRPDTTGVEAFTGSVPKSADVVEHAADSIGQGTILASPLTVATVSAAVAAGRYIAPRLVLDQDSTQGTPASSQAGQQSGTALPAGTIATLRALTAEVVTKGSGTALRGVPGEPVHGKTGTAEFGSDNPPKTHAWFTGYQGDVAFAVVVEGGGFGGKVAAPVAARFLTGLG